MQTETKVKAPTKKDVTMPVLLKTRLGKSDGTEVDAYIKELRGHSNSSCEGAVTIVAYLAGSRKPQIFTDYIMFSNDDYGGWGFDPSANDFRSADGYKLYAEHATKCVLLALVGSMMY
jgi:hypothetical protein